MNKRIRVIAGPNGSGKTTLYHELEKLVNLYDFINADEILKLLLTCNGHFMLPFALESGELAATINSTSFDNSIKQLYNNGAIQCVGREVQFTSDSVNSYTVAAFADFLRNAYLRRGINFTMETVFSHPSKLQFLEYAKELGYRVYLYFIATDSPELNIARVKQRVKIGGHDVPPEKIISRYSRCLDNLYEALTIVYRAYIWDNSTHPMCFFAELKPERSLEIVGEIPNWFNKYVLDKDDFDEEEGVP